MSEQNTLSRRRALKLGGAGGTIAGMMLATAATDLRAQATSGTYFNVKDYGAVGNGSTNDSAAIEQAIEAANPSGGSEFERNQLGGVVYLPAGTYLVDQIRLRRNVTLLGEGMGTIIVQADGTNSAVISPLNNKEYPVCVSDLRIRGTRRPGGSGRSARGILLNTVPEFGGFTVPDGQHILNRVWIEGTHAENIFIAENCRGTLVSDCWLSSSNTAAGIVVDGSDSTISNVISRSHAGDGFQITSGNARLQNCKAFFCRGNGFLVDGTRANLSVCEAQDNWINGLHIRSRNSIISSCLADSNQLAGFNVDPRGGYIGGICMNGFMAIGRPQVQSGKPWTGQPIGLLLNNGFIQDSLFAGVTRDNSVSQLQVNATLNEQTQIAQVIVG